MIKRILTACGLAASMLTAPLAHAAVEQGSMTFNCEAAHTAAELENYIAVYTDYVKYAADIAQKYAKDHGGSDAAIAIVGSERDKRVLAAQNLRFGTTDATIDYPELF
ncbi:MAG: hypothetical protein Q3962_02705 [Corynebacterium sp.]|nr:hypothetical protein [Corynebacterium sp.]